MGKKCQQGCRLHGITEAIDKRVGKCERGGFVVNQKLPAFTVGLVLIVGLWNAMDSQWSDDAQS
jgi:hypothetical protein